MARGLDGLARGDITSRAVLITEFWALAKVQLSLKPLLSSALFPTGPFSFRRHSHQIYTFALRVLFLGLWVVWFFPKVPKAVVTDRSPKWPRVPPRKGFFVLQLVEEISQVSITDAAFFPGATLFLASVWFRNI